MSIHLRDDQLTVIESARSAVESGCRAIFLTAPPGWGKTVVLSALVALVETLFDSVRRILWVAHRDQLLLQGLEALHAVAPRCIPITTWLNIASRRHHAADVLVVDEAHRDAAATYARIRDRVGAQFVLAASATPYRADRSGLAFDAVIHAPAADDLIRSGILSPYAHFAVLGPATTEAMCTTLIEGGDRWGKSIVFARDCIDAHRAAATLRAAGIAALPALGGPGKDSALAALRSGRVEVLTAVHALTEGIDVPSIRSVFLRDSWRGPTIQALGRALRRNGDKVANVIQSANARTSVLLLARPQCRWVGTPEGPWSPLPVEPLWPPIAASHRTQIHQRRNH